jgi:hypothetical protein
MKKKLSRRAGLDGVQPRAAPARLSFVALLLSLPIICLSSSTRLNSVSAQDKKMTAEELVARHLESIGAAEARAKAETRVASGVAKLIIRIGGAANTDGQAMMVSSGAKFRFGLKFGLADYPGEDMAFDGAKTATGFLTQGRRSNLSVFLNSQNLPLKEGLLGGALSTTWPLLRLDQSQPKLDYRGLKKVDGRQLHEIGYRPRRGSNDLKVLLYFDPETFRHVKTKYSFEISATIGARDDPNQNPESHYSLTEDFDDFRAVDALRLPHKYRLQYSAESKNGSALYDWSVTINQIAHNTKIDDEVFVIR